MGLFSILKDKKGDAKTASSQDAAGSLTVAGRAKSEYHTQQKHAQFGAAAYDRDTQSPKIGALYKNSNSKSFTATGLAAQAAQLSVTAHEAQHHGEGRASSVAGMRYTSIQQFSSKIELYRGSISTVYKAVCSATQETVIIKSYEKAKMKQKNFLRMEREIRLMHLLGGDGIVQLFAVFEDDAFKHLVMEYCRGGDLFKLLLLRGGTLEEHWVCLEIIVPMLKVLVRMHSEHILHRDIKPENIFLSARHRFKMGDLGLAICSTEELPFTRSGTLDYMAPEVLANPTADLQEGPSITRTDLKARGVRAYDEKVDVWAAGILAYELVIGRPPFEVNDEVQTATMIMFSNNINFPARHGPLWADFVRAALEKKPHVRPTAAQMLEHPWVLHHQTKAQLEAPAVAPPPQELAPLSEAVVSTVAALPEPSQLPPVTTAVVAAAIAERTADDGAAKATAIKKSASMGSALRQADLQHRLQQAAITRPEAPVRPAARPLADSASKAAAAAHLKHSLQEDACVRASGGSFSALMDSARARPAQPPADAALSAEERAGGIRSRMKHYFHRQLGTEVPLDVRKEGGIVGQGP